MIDYLYYALLLLGILLFYFAWQQLNRTRNLLLNGTKTQSTVVKLIPVSGDKGMTYRPIYEYQDRNNITQTFESQVSSRPAPHQIGDKVAIIYDPNLKVQKTISFWGLYRNVIVLLCLAMPLLVIGGGYLLYKMSENGV